MITRISTRFVATAFVSALALSTVSEIQAQIPGSAIPRTADERVAKELPTPPPINSEYRKAAEGQLPAAPRQIAPPTREAPRSMQAAPAGLDVAMLAEHALSMAIEGSGLQGLADRDASGQPVDESAKALMDEAKHHMTESKALMARATLDLPAGDPNGPARRFVNGVNNYLTTLAALSDPSMIMKSSEKAQVALVNHAVKGVLDADHIQQFGRAYAGSQAVDQLLNHARAMKSEGMESVSRMATTSAFDPTAPPSAKVLAQKGVELFAAADQLRRISMPGVTSNGNPGTSPQPGTNPAPLLNNRPEIIGGTYSNGSPSTGTSTGAEAVPRTPRTDPAIPSTDPGSPVRPR